MHGDDNKHNIKELECKRKKMQEKIKCMNKTQKKWNAKREEKKKCTRNKMYEDDNKHNVKEMECRRKEKMHEK